MNTPAIPLSPSDNLAATGRALYGERWQTPLSLALQVNDRTMRRWLSGEMPLPDEIVQELRVLLLKHLESLGALIKFTVNPDQKTVFHHPTAACWSYDDEFTLKLVFYPQIPEEEYPLLQCGAEEALRQHREREGRMQYGYANPQTGRISTHQEITIDYKGCQIMYPRIRADSARWLLNVSSNNPSLFNKIGGVEIIEDFTSLESALNKARQFVDSL